MKAHQHKDQNAIEVCEVHGPADGHHDEQQVEPAGGEQPVQGLGVCLAGNPAWSPGLPSASAIRHLTPIPHFVSCPLQQLEEVISILRSPTIGRVPFQMLPACDIQWLSSDHQIGILGNPTTG